MFVLFKSDLVVESSTGRIEVDATDDCFVSATRRHYDPRPSTGGVVVEMDFPVESYCEYRVIDNKPVLINPVAPAAVSMRQARLALLAGGLLPSINAALEAMPGIEGEAARIEWEYATEVRRDSALVAGLAGALGLANEQLDQLFLAAGEL